MAELVQAEWVAVVEAGMRVVRAKVGEMRGEEDENEMGVRAEEEGSRCDPPGEEVGAPGVGVEVGLDEIVREEGACC